MDVGLALAVQIQADPDLSFLGMALNEGLAMLHAGPLKQEEAGETKPNRSFEGGPEAPDPPRLAWNARFNYPMPLGIKEAIQGWFHRLVAGGAHRAAG